METFLHQGHVCRVIKQKVKEEVKVMLYKLFLQDLVCNRVNSNEVRVKSAKRYWSHAYNNHSDE